MSADTLPVLNDRYKLEKLLSEGLMSSVQLGFDQKHQTPVILKSYRFPTGEAAKQVEKEARALAGIRHPNLPRVLDYFVIETSLHLVMDQVSGTSLEQRVTRSGALSESEVLPWFLEICDAVACLHAGGRPHGGIKPENILISPDGRAVLVGYGLSAAGSLERPRSIAPGISPPEQYGAAELDQRSDTFALGGTLYRLLTGSPPEDSLERMMGRLELTPPLECSKKMRPQLSQVLEKALSLYPDNRYPGVIKLADAVVNAANNGHPTLVRKYPYLDRTIVASHGPASTRSRSASRLRASPRVRRLLGWLGAAVLLAALALLALRLLPGLSERWANAAVAGGNRPTPVSLPETATADSPGATPTELSPTNPPDPAGGGSLTVLPAAPTAPASTATAGPTLVPLSTALGGGRGEIVFASNRSGMPQLFLLKISDGEIRQLTEHEGGACQPDWSPDGERLVFVSPCPRSRQHYPGASLWLMNADGSGLQQLPSVPGGDFDPAWSPDGKQIAFTSLRDGTLRLYAIVLDDLRLIDYGNNLPQESQPDWSLDGERLVFVTTRLNHDRLYFKSLSTGVNREYVISETGATSNPDWSTDGAWMLYDQTFDGIRKLMGRSLLSPEEAEFRICPSGVEGGLPMTEGRWSPDSAWIIAEAWLVSNDHNLALMRSDCTDFRWLTDDLTHDFDAAWRPR